VVGVAGDDLSGRGGSGVDLRRGRRAPGLGLQQHIPDRRGGHEYAQQPDGVGDPVSTELRIRLEDVPDHPGEFRRRLPGALDIALALTQIALLGRMQPAIQGRLGDQEVLLHPAPGNAVVRHMPQDLEPLKGRVALPAGSVSVACLEQAVLRLQLAILIPQPGQLAHLSANGSALLQPEQPPLTGRLGTQHHGSNHQGNGCSEDLHADTLLKRERRPEAPPKGLIW